MTVDGSPDEPGATWATSSSSTILWRPVVGRDLFEARIPARSGRSPGWYAGYVARTPGDGDDEWRGYIGLTHVPIGMGRREAVQAVVERRVRELLATRAAGGGDESVTRGKRESRESVDHAS